METKYELRAEFENGCDIVATEDGECMYIEQEESLIAIPLNQAAAFLDKLGDWLSFGRLAS